MRNYIILIDFLLMGHGALSSLEAGDFRNAQRFLDKMSSSSSMVRPSDKGLYHYVAGYNSLLHKDFGEAARHADIALKFAEETGLPIAEALSHILISHARYELGEYQKAATHLKRGLDISSLSRFRRLEFVGLITKAYFVFDNRREKTGVALLKRLWR